MKNGLNFGHLSELFLLEGNSVALKYSYDEVDRDKNKPTRICRGLIESREGKTVVIGKANHQCMGGNYWCGLSEEITERHVHFISEVEHVYCSHAAAIRSFKLGPQPPQNLGKSIILSPLLTCEFKPDLVLLFVKPRNASELLPLTVYHSGVLLRDIFVNGSTCRTAIANPLLTGQVGISFIDMAGRTRYKEYKDEELLLSFPFNIFETMIKAYEEKRLLPKYVPAN